MSVRITDLPYSSNILLPDVFPFVAVADAGGEGITKHATVEDIADRIESHFVDTSAFATLDQLNAAVGNSGISHALLATVSAAVADILYPVGCLYFDTVSTNPAVRFNFGVWASYGAGRTIVGQTSADSDFNASGKTGGTKVHTLTINEMPAHSHYIYGYGVESANRTPEIIIDDDRRSASLRRSTESTGGGASHNNMPPYIVSYIWRRTA